MKTEQFFCLYLFNQISITPDGKVQFCCRSDYIEKECKDEHEPKRYFNIYDESFETIWKSREFNNYRLNVLNGIPIKPCNCCYNQERINGTSLRMQVLESGMISHGKSNLPDLISEYRQEFMQNETWTRWPVIFHLWGSNKCNYKCRMCSSFYSSKIAADPIQFNWRPDRKLEIPSPNRLEGLRWIDSESLLYDELFREHHNIRIVSLAGGEPFVETANAKLLNKFIDLGIAGNIDLKLNTNCSIVTDKLIDSLSKFHHVDIRFSIDGFDKTNEYIRHGSKWQVVHSNLMKFLQLKNGIFCISPTVSIYNIFDLETLIEYSIKNNVKIRLADNVLRNPDFLSFRALPGKCIESAIEFWNNLKIKYQRTYLQNDIALLLLELNHCLGKESRELYVKFRKYTGQLDQSRGEDLSQGSPNLFQQIKHYPVEEDLPNGLPGLYGQIKKITRLRTLVGQWRK